MKRIPSWTWTAVGIPLALVIGIVVGRSNASDTDERTGATTVPSREIPTRKGAGMGDDARQNNRSADRSSERGGSSSRQLGTILESNSRLDRTQRLLAFLDRLPTDEFAAVYESIANSPMEEIRGSERSLILQAWAERDPLAAIDYLETNAETTEDWERETTLTTWAALDPQGAYAWAINSEDNGSVNNWLVGTMRGIASTNPELARDFLVQMEDDKTRRRSLQTMEAYVMQFGSDYAENWIAGISDESIQNQASRSMARELAELDPVRAGEWNAKIGDTETRRAVSETVSDRWAREDLEGAKRWVETLPEDTRTEAAEGVARHYARQDPLAAANWLSGLGTNPDYDGARQILVRESYRNDPATSLGYISNITDQRTREKSYDRYLRDWMRRDTDSATSWALSNQDVLPERVVKRYLR